MKHWSSTRSEQFPVLIVHSLAAGGTGMSGMYIDQPCGIFNHKTLNNLLRHILLRVSLLLSLQSLDNGGADGASRGRVLAGDDVAIDDDVLAPGFGSLGEVGTLLN